MMMRLKYKTRLTAKSLDEDFVVHIGEDTPYRPGEENPTGDIIIQDVDGRQICLDKTVAPIMIEWLVNFVERGKELEVVTLPPAKRTKWRIVDQMIEEHGDGET